MICLGVDPGQKRVGIALGQVELAISLQTVDRSVAIQEVSRIATEKNALRIYVGKPSSLSGADTKSTLDALEFATALQAATPVPVFLLDERLTTKQSQRSLREVGLTAKSNKAAVDSESARLIVELAIACKHSCGESVIQSA